MKREIKFRGRCIITGNWAYGYYYLSKGNHIIIDADGGEVMVMPKSVGQFTGLKDKKREVYESDLYELRVNGIETHVEIILCEVKWSVKGCGFGFFLLTKDSEQPNWIGMNDKNIIGKKHLGNIHENKDLLSQPM